MQWTITIYTLIKKAHIRIICAKFGKNTASSLGGDFFWSKHHDAQCATHNQHPMITIAHHEPMAQVSLKCIWLQTSVKSHVFALFISEMAFYWVIFIIKMAYLDVHYQWKQIWKYQKAMLHANEHHSNHKKCYKQFRIHFCNAIIHV